MTDPGATAVLLGTFLCGLLLGAGLVWEAYRYR